MKFILSFVILTSVLSAETCYKLSLGNAALTTAKLCAPNTEATTGIKCESPAAQLPTQSSIKCNLPIVIPTPIVSKCTPLPIECPKPTTPVIPIGGGKCDPGGPHTSPNAPAAPEPASYALLGAGLVTAGIARKFRKKA